MRFLLPFQCPSKRHRKVDFFFQITLSVYCNATILRRRHWNLIEIVLIFSSIHVPHVCICFLPAIFRAIASNCYFGLVYRLNYSIVYALYYFIDRLQPGDCGLSWNLISLPNRNMGCL